MIKPFGVFVLAGLGLTLLVFRPAAPPAPQGANLPSAQTPAPHAGNEKRTIVVRALKNHWNFDPKIIEVRTGERIILKIFNEDEYDHGFAVEALGINERLPADKETLVEFVAGEAGQFPFYCSIVCGQGHYHMTGRIVVTE